MKKKLLLPIIMALVVLMATPCFAASIREGFEPEDDGAASFSTHVLVQDWGYMLDIYFTNYANADGTHEYWFMLNIPASRIKLLNTMSLDIDGENYDFKAMKEPSEKYQLAAWTLIDNHVHMVYGGAERSNYRYFIVPEAVVAKMKSAQNVAITYHATNVINQTMKFPSNFIASINKVTGYGLDNLTTLWHPKDRKAK